MRKIAGRSAVAAALLMSSASNAFDLSGTIFDAAGRNAGLDPKLLYSVALAESALGRGQGQLGPHPWTLRSDYKVVYAKTRAEAEQSLTNHIAKYGKLIDVGLMQINLRWHGEKVKDPIELLDPKTNLQLAAEYLSQMISSTPSDIELAIGKYHVGPVATAENTPRARNYGSRVLAIYRNLLSLSGQP